MGWRINALKNHPAVLKIMKPIEYINNLINKDKCYMLDNGKVALYHHDIEVMAAHYKVSVNVDIKVADGKERFAVVKGVATRDGQIFTSLGEAHPANNDFAYFVAVAEKRAADRAILKALLVHGEVLSVEELPPEIKKKSNKKQNNVTSVKDQVEKKILSTKDKYEFDKVLGKHASYLETLANENPGEADDLLNKIQVKQKEMEDK